MAFIFGKQDMRTLEQAHGRCVLLTNGLGGYAAVTASGAVNRCDQGVLISAVRAPNERITLVHRLRESVTIGGRQTVFSTQEFADGTYESGLRYLNGFSYDGVPKWTYQFGGICIKRRLFMAWEKNTVAVVYEIENASREVCTLTVEPMLKFSPKEQAVQAEKTLACVPGGITDGTYTVYVDTNGNLQPQTPRWETLAYPEDEKDGRPAKGMCGSCCGITMTIQPDTARTLEVVFSGEPRSLTAAQVGKSHCAHRALVLETCPLTDPVARQLALAADDFIVRRDSTNGKTILAGYPLFSDWGRDTMIALQGCCLSAGRLDDAKSILRTFLAYEKDGLVPNLFPEGQCAPMYNTVDAALLLIECVWQYVQRSADTDFVREAWPVLERIIAAYRKGTHHSIRMDTDGLISAGGGLDQVTWMDVCVNGILPTPRHGKPVEINAYWYNALRIMDTLAQRLGLDAADYGQLATRVKASFVDKFYMEDKGYLKDVLSGTDADTQLRCNQIWAVSMSFTMLSAQQEKRVVQSVYRSLYTPCGLRTLSPEDPQYHGSYGGSQVQRDMAYHQGTTWVFPLGAYYLAWLKVHGNTPEAARKVREQLDALVSMLREGCLGQLPEIYDGDFPAEGKGCFAQAWSVGEMLRVFEAVETIEKSENLL